MTNIPWRWTALLLLACALPVAAAPDVELDDDGLVIEFDEAMQTWTQARPAGIATRPALPLHCRWDSDTRLACAIADNTKPRRATRYTVSLPPMFTQDGKRLPGGRLMAETDRPRLSISPWSTRWDRGLPLLRMDATPDVDRAAAARAVEVSVDGQRVRIDLVAASDTPTESSAFLLRLSEPVPPDALLEVRVRPGLVSREGPLRGTQDTILLRAHANESPRLERASCAIDHALRPEPVAGATVLACEPGAVALTFSRRLQTGAAARIAQALPAGARLLDTNESARSTYGREPVVRMQGEVVRLSVDAPRTRVRIDLPRDLRDADGQPVASASVVVVTGDHPPSVQAPHASLLLADPRAPLSVTAINAPAGASVSTWTLAREAAAGQVAIPPGPTNASVPVGDAATHRSLAAGGWARWKDERMGRWSPALHLAAPQLDVFTAIAGDEVLAWVHDWNGRPTARARVELLLAGRGEPARVNVHGITDATGVARLALPDGYEVGAARQHHEWFVRAEARGRRAVLPLGESGYGLDLGRPGTARAWGVTDRPLYRAGDTVHFRLWSREQRGSRLRMRAPQAGLLHLISREEDKAIRSWAATPDGEGWTGEVVIPEHATDGDYCVIPDGPIEFYENGACFFVGTYRSQDLWVEAKADDRVLRTGGRFEVDVSAGYYSGGPASAVKLGRVTTMLTGQALSTAFPQYANYTFVDVMNAAGRNGVRLQLPPLPERTNAEGTLRLVLPLDFDSRDGEDGLPAFGRLQATAELALDAREGTTSNAASTRFARFPAYVGLRLQPRWLDGSTPVRVESVVIDADGAALAGREVEVEVDFLPGHTGNAPPQRLATCRLRSGAMSPCDFPRARSGRYRLTARSGDGAAAQVEQYVWTGGAAGGDKVQPVLEVASDSTVDAGAQTRLALRNATPGESVLFVVHRGGRILGHSQATVRTANATYDVALPADAHGRIGITAYLRDPAAGGDVIGVLRRPVGMRSASTEVEVARAVSPPVAVAFERTHTAPGARVVLVVRNTSAVAREVSLSVMDDALRALAGEWLELSDPQGSAWLGEIRDRRHRAGLDTRSFERWNGAAWRMTFPRIVPAITGSLPSPPEDPPVLVDDPSPVDVPASAPPVPVEVADNGYGEASTLDRIEVTGSRISAADAWGEGRGRADAPEMRMERADGESTPVSGAPRPGRVEGGAGGLLARIARVRSAFADSAHWIGHMRLAAGETRRIDVVLPDNLTRWRAVAWSVGGAEDFEMADATIEAGLAVEARLQAPVRLYPGDTARLVGNARQTVDVPGRVEVALTAVGAAVAAETATTLELPARGQAPFTLHIAPQEPGGIETVAAVRMAQGDDGVGGRIEVASPLVEGRRVQAGFVDVNGVALAVPAAPAGSRDVHLHVALQRGATALIERWTHDLRVYEHRCWEQILSRAIGAALALERGDPQWPDAHAAVAEALDNAAVFQDSEGGFHYFADAMSMDEDGEPRHEIVLTAWSVQALEQLQALGHAVPAEVLDAARENLRSHRLRKGEEAADSLAEAAFAAAAVDTAAPQRDALWEAWPTAATPVRVATARALQRVQDARAGEAWTRLLAEAPRRGARRVLGARGEWMRWMASPLREQCTLIELAAQHAQESARRELIAGLADLYAGGVDATDTQSAAVCLLALRDVGTDRERAVSVMLRAGTRDIPLQIAAQADRTGWDAPAQDIGALRITGDARSSAFPSYVVELRYLEDARLARGSAVGLDIERRYDVLRDGRWQPLGDGPLGENDWVRVTLVVNTTATRHFVALTDGVPGGLRPTDLRLSGVAGLDLQALSDGGSAWFGTRRLDPRAPKFYAQWLPAGRHEVYYFARAVHVGSYLATPATAELMYGNVSHARTAAKRVVIEVR